MSDLNYIRAYFIGIGGIGMSAIALYFKQRGIQVYGYDRNRTEIAQRLEKAGIPVVYGDDAQLIPEDFSKENRSGSLVVYTPAVPRDNAIYRYFAQAGFEVIKRSDALSRITLNSINLAVAGTHGKTTISAMLAHVFIDNQIPVTAFVGGIMTNYDSNFVTRGGEVTITEADEFDKSFFKLSPNYALISSTDADHLDVYGSAEEFAENFELFAKMAAENGLVIAQEDTHVPADFKYGRLVSCDYQITDVAIDGLTSKVVIRIPGGNSEFTLTIPGKHNVENALGAFAMAHQYGLDPEDIARSLSSFKGVKRRFEVHYNNANYTYIDDYAHHPSELKALIQSLRTHFPDRPIHLIFQPHLYSRTRDFMEGFAEVLSTVDMLVLMPIYPAREMPIAGIDSEKLFGKVRISQKYILDSNEVLKFVEEQRPELLVTAGAGDIDQLVDPIKRIYQS